MSNYSTVEFQSYSHLFHLLPERNFTEQSRIGLQSIIIVPLCRIYCIYIYICIYLFCVGEITVHLKGGEN